MMRNQFDASLLKKIAEYTERLVRDPQSTVFVSLCEAYRQMGLLDEAYRIALEGTRRHPEFAPGHVALGRIQAQRKEFDDAIASFEKALVLEEENLHALKGLARIHFLGGEKEEARAFLEKAREIRPEDLAVQKMLAALGSAPVQKSVESPVKTAEDIKESSQVSPEPADPMITPTIAELYLKQGFPDRALKIYRNLLDADPQNEALRAKYIDLKRQLEGGLAEEAEVITQSVLTEAQTEKTPEVSVASDTCSVEERQIKLLNSWLESISRRRAHVQ